MTDPTRLLDEGGTSLEMRLLRSGKAEEPPVASVAHAIQLARQVGMTPPAPSQGAWGSAAKWMGVGLVGMGLVGALLAREQPSAPPPVKPAVVAPEARVTTDTSPWLPVPGEPTPPSSLPFASDPGPETPRLSAKKSLAADSPPASSAGPSNDAPLNPADDSFAAELRAVDQARRAIAVGDYAGGLRLLDVWAVAFPQKRFDEEAAVLRIEAVRGSGDRERSTQLARQFLAAHPTSPLAQRVRSQLSEPPP
jgi:hypothetical protein